MEVKPQQAAESLREIERAKVLATRHSENNGTVQIAWGIAIIVGLAGFDVFPRLVALILGPGKAVRGIGPITAAIFLALIAFATAIWISHYVAHRPVKPLKIENKKLFIWWGFYHTLVILLGTFGGLWLSLPPFWFTGLGILSAVPLLIVGWRMRQRAYALEG